MKDILLEKAGAPSRSCGGPVETRRHASAELLRWPCGGDTETCQRGAEQPHPTSHALLCFSFAQWETGFLPT